MDEPRSSRLGRRGGAAVSKKTPNGAARSAYTDFFPAVFPAGPEDYAEIFGGLATSCSIPVLDLPPEIDGGDDAPCGPWSSGFDYAEIFRGFDGGDFAVSYEELVAESRRPEKKTLSSNERTPNETVFNQQTTKISDLPSEGSDGGDVACLERDQILSDSHGSNDESIDHDVPYQKTSQASMVDLVNGKAHVTQSHVFPGSMFVADACSLLQNIESDDCANKVNNDLSFNQHFNMGRTEGKQEKIFSYASSSGGAKGFENDVFEDQKHFAIRPLASEDDGPTNTSNHSHSSSYQSTSSGDISHPNYTFLTVSDISLQTQPLKMPPPSRPPPKADYIQGHLKTKKPANPKADLDEEKLYKKMIDHQTHHGGDAYKNHVLQEAVKGNKSYFFDVEVDASSAAAAMKEAMEQAQARLKSAKELMERKRDNFRSCKKFGNRGVNCKERKEYTAAEEVKSFSEGMTQETILRVDREVNYVTINEKQQAPKAPMVNLELEEKETNKASTEKGRQTMDQKETASSQPSIRLEEQNVKRKVDKQFNKLKNDMKEFKMVHDGSEHEGFEEKPITAVQTNEDKVNEREVLQDFKIVQEVSEQEPFSNISQILKKANGDREYESEVGKVVCEHKRNGNLHAVKESCEWDKNIKKHGARIMAVSEEELKEMLNSIPDVSVQEQNNNELEVPSEVSVQQENENSLKEAPDFNQQGESEMKLEEEEKLHVCVEENKPNDAEEAFACKDEDEKSKAFVEACRTDGVYQFEGEDKKPLAGTFTDCGMEMNATFVRHKPDEGDNMKFGNKSGWQYENNREVGVPHGSCLCKVKEKMNASSEASQSEENEKTNIPANVSFAPGLNEYKLEGINVTLQQETKKLNGIRGSHELVSNENIMEVTPDDLDMEENEKKHEAALNNAVEDAKNEKELEAVKEACQQDYIVKKTREAPLEHQQNGKNQRVVHVTHEVEKFKSRLTVDKEEQGLQDIDHIKEDKVASHAAKSNKWLNIGQEVCQVVEEKYPEAARQAILFEEKRNVTNRVLDVAETCVRTENTTADTQKEDRREIKGKFDRKTEQEKELARKLEEEKEREREREKDRLAVERASHGAHERAFAESRERAERIVVERVTAEARQRALAEAREKAERASSEALEKSIAEKASREAKLRAERAAVERATAEARDRAAEKAAAEARERAERSRLKPTDIQDASNGTQRQSVSLNQGMEGESALRCKARLERHQRTVERAAKALAEKNMRDILAQREQAERNRLAESLDAEVRRWSNGKEGNLRALLSTLQYILGPDSGWQPIPLTDVITAAAVKKAYKKAALYVHPDKLQQRGASIHQKYICEKVFDLLKDAWNRFNSEER